MAGGKAYPKVQAEYGAEVPYQVVLGTDLYDWVSDAPVGYNGAETGPSPFELLSSALASCTLITLQMYAERKPWNLGNTSASVQVTPAAEQGGRYTVESVLRFDESLSEEQREKLTEIAGKCPVHKVLSQAMDIVTKREN